MKAVHKNEEKLLCIYFISLKRREPTSRTIYNLCECITKQKINSNNYNRLLQKDWWIDTTTCSNAGTANYVILSLECFPLIKRFEVQNFELLLSCNHKLTCFTLFSRDERKKSEVNSEADYFR